jgi:hypothetical protein
MNAFDDLTLDDRIHLLRLGGVPIITVTTPLHYVTLFLLDNFFVETYLCIQSKSINRISTCDYANMDKYLDHIDITEVYGLLL